MKDMISFVGSVKKVTTFTSKGGGLNIAIEAKLDDDEVISSLFKSTQMIADIDMKFRPTAGEDDDDERQASFDYDEDEPVETNEGTGQFGIRDEYVDEDGAGMDEELDESDFGDDVDDEEIEF